MIIIKLLIATIIVVLYFKAGMYALKLIKKRDKDAPLAVDIIVVMHGVFSLITALAIQKLLFLDEEEYVSTSVNVKLDKTNVEHQKILKMLEDLEEN